MMVGRDAECARVDALLERVAQGGSGALVISGEPGIGKTALLRYALGRSDHMRPLTSRAIESESELSFAGLSDLVQPLLGYMDLLPDPQRVALSGALALGPAEMIDPFTICAATMGLLAAAADDGPLVVAVDDAHWLDQSSATALLFSSRRLHAEGIAVILCLRSGEGRYLDTTEIPELHLSGLDRAASEQLLTQNAPAIARGVRDTLLRATAGNPLALIEIRSGLSEEQLAGSEALPDPLPVGNELRQGLLRRVGRLPKDTQEALKILAASDSAEIDVLGRALSARGYDPNTLQVAEAAGIVTTDARHIEFTHPLMRAAVYHTAPPHILRAAHRALAGALTAERDADRRAWHLAAAAIFPDENVAATLNEVGLDARRRGAYAASAQALERAAQLTPDDAARVSRLLEAAKDHRLIGRSQHALGLLDEAEMLTGDPEIGVDIEHTRTRVLVASGSAKEAHTRLLTLAERINQNDRERAAALVVEAVGPCFMTGELAIALDTARRGLGMARRVGGEIEWFAESMLGMALLLKGEGQDALPLITAAADILHDADLTVVGDVMYFGIAQTLVWLEEYERARLLIERAISEIRSISALGMLPYGLAVLSELDLRVGDLSTSFANAAESNRLAHDAELRGDRAFSLVCLARVEAVFGRGDDCRHHIRQAGEIMETGEVGCLKAHIGSVLGLLELSLGRPGEAIRILKSVADFARRVDLSDPSTVQWAPDLIEAFVRVGRIADARYELEAFQRQAERTKRGWALAASARLRGLLADQSGFQFEFEQALCLEDGLPHPFERARTELCYGERLRRSGQRREARAHLQSALGMFEALGAVPWEARARTELGATGVSARRKPAHLSRTLTAQELQVALAVSKGLTNREAAAALFLSHKTIEAHLGRIYAKLDLHSRTELAHLLLKKEPALATGAREPG